MTPTDPLLPQILARPGLRPESKLALLQLRALAAGTVTVAVAALGAAQGAADADRLGKLILNELAQAGLVRVVGISADAWLVRLLDPETVPAAGPRRARRGVRA